MVTGGYVNVLIPIDVFRWSSKEHRIELIALKRSGCSMSCLVAELSAE